MPRSEQQIKNRGTYEFLKEDLQLLQQSKKPYLDQLSKMICNKPMTLDTVRGRSIFDEIDKIDDEIDTLTKKINELKELLGL